MINQFSPKVSEVLSYSREEAERLLSHSVGPEHIMLAILREREGAVSNMFGTLNLNLENIKSQLEERIKSEEQSQLTYSNDIMLNEQASNILKLAVLEARIQSTQTVDVQHILLAILHDNTENGAKEVLQNNNLNYTTALEMLQQPTKPVQDGMGMADEEEEEVLDSVDDKDWEDDTILTDLFRKINPVTIILVVAIIFVIYAIARVVF